MTDHSLQDIQKIESSLWEAADQLRANSKLTSSEYCMPILGIIFLRHATNRYNAVLERIAGEKASGKLPKGLPITKAHFVSRRALMLPKIARYDELLRLPSGSDLGTALVAAMDAIEKDFEPLSGQLPKDYEKFDNDLLESMLRTFDSEPLRQASGDVFGRIYEYFLMKFALQGAQDNGEFFTPPSLVQLIVNVIEPNHGVVADLACGSAGMFVQSSHFIEESGGRTMDKVTFYGQEKTATTIRLAKMNLAVHGLEGDIREANTFYEDVHRLPDGRPLWGNVDFTMANPPFNVDQVDAGKIENDRRLPFGLPGVNKGKKVSNGNYLWICAAKPAAQRKFSGELETLAAACRDLVKDVDLVFKLALRVVDTAEKDADAKDDDSWNTREIGKLEKDLDARRAEIVGQLKATAYFERQAHWLLSRFPDAKLVDVPGLVKLVDRAEIAAADWSLTPGRYVGVAPAEVDDDFDFEQALGDIHVEIKDLNQEAAELAKRIQKNFEGLGV